MHYQKLTKNRLWMINRKGMDGLLRYLDSTDFYAAPASTRFHGCYPGGLVKHSWQVYHRLCECAAGAGLDEVRSPGQKPLPITDETLPIAGLLHDVCKIGAYIPTPNGNNAYRWNRAQPRGHATLSIKRIKEFIELTELEEMMIRYHMGVYGLNEAYDEDDWQQGEYPLRGDHSNDENLTKEESQQYRYGQSLMNAWFHNPVCKVMYFCDELVTLAEKAQ